MACNCKVRCDAVYLNGLKYWEIDRKIGSKQHVVYELARKVSVKGESKFSVNDNFIWFHFLGH